MNARESAAKENVERDLRRLGLDWTVEVVHRLIDGFTLYLHNGAKTFVQTGIDERVLEDQWSSARDRIIAAARLKLEGPGEEK